MLNCIIYDVGGYAVTAHADDDDKQYGTQIGIGDATSGNFNNLDEYENTYTVTAVSPADFVRLCKSRLSHPEELCTLQKSNNGMNFGAIQNEDFEFVSAS